MAEYGPETYGERWAEVYDDWIGRYGMPAHVDDVADALSRMAGSGPALELAIGTGRVALPLAARGVEVHGIDASEAMVAKLRTKPGGHDIRVTVGDFADVAVDGDYPLIFVVFHTFFVLPTQEEQVRCFANVARHLTPGGVFVIEAFLPDVSAFDRGQRIDAASVETDALHVEGSRHDAVAQRVDAVSVVVQDSSIRVLPVQIRYAWPSELDSMAQMAGLRLYQRWGGWRHEPFTSESAYHVSVYERKEP